MFGSYHVPTTSTKALPKHISPLSAGALQGQRRGVQCGLCCGCMPSMCAWNLRSHVRQSHTCTPGSSIFARGLSVFITLPCLNMTLFHQSFMNYFNRPPIAHVALTRMCATVLSRRRDGRIHERAVNMAVSRRTAGVNSVGQGYLSVFLHHCAANTRLTRTSSMIWVSGYGSPSVKLLHTPSEVKTLLGFKAEPFRAYSSGQKVVSLMVFFCVARRGTP
jgi:hypothetical protein